MTTGSRESFARTRSAAPATWSASAIQVAESVRPLAVEAAAPVLERLQPGAAERDLLLAVSPGAPEGVADEHRRRGAAQLAQALAQRAGGAVGIVRKQHERVRRGGVGGVDAGVRANEALGRAADQHPALGANEHGGLVEDDLHRSRVLVGAPRELAAPARRASPSRARPSAPRPSR